MALLPLSLFVFSHCYFFPLSQTLQYASAIALENRSKKLSVYTSFEINAVALHHSWSRIPLWCLLWLLSLWFMTSHSSKHYEYSCQCFNALCMKSFGFCKMKQFLYNSCWFIYKKILLLNYCYKIYSPIIIFWLRWQIRLKTVCSGNLQKANSHN